ncbi:FtsK/SpoIIIE family DNA translocase [Fusicatenibacter faecihominis]|uniref:DNA translocase FtsK n=1 Tax=Fusicatenibacter faecihominis TaxID=2881276 RepID=A0AAE3J5A5_9FIRM|nr:DNA translocase FtsK [Fusicatenibacter faecihominis]MCC2188924.1 DNA translocase FtsK [Fusicatenibacter faecihominis]
MAAKKETETQKTTGRKQTASKRPSASSAKKTSSAPRGNGKGQQKKKESVFGFPFAQEVILWGTLALSVILFISNFGIGGFVGDAISRFFFGVFGFMAYLLPLILFFMVAFLISNRNNPLAWMKAAAVILLVICVCTVVELALNSYQADRDFLDFYKVSAVNRSGGGLAGGVLCTLVCPAFGVAGAYVLVVVLMILCMVLITERSFFEDFRKTGKKVYKNVYENTREDAAIRRERAAIREEKRRIIREEQRKMQREQLEKEKDQLKTLPETLRRNQKVSGVNLNGLVPRSMPLEEVHEIVPPVPKTRPEVEELNLKVMDQAIGGKSFQVPPRERIPKASPKLPFVDRKFPEPEIQEVEEEVTPVSIHEQRPSSFEEQLRINGELVSAARNQAEEQAQEPEDGGEFMEATDELYQPLRQPVFLQRADEAEDADPEEIFRERWGTPEDPTADGLEFHREFQEAEEIPPFGEEETEVPESCEDASMEEVPHEENPEVYEEPENDMDADEESEDPEDPEPFRDSGDMEEIIAPSTRSSDSIFREDNSLRPTSAGTVFQDAPPAPGEKQFRNPKSSQEEQQKNQENVAKEIEASNQVIKKEYVFPPLDLLSKPKSNPAVGRDQELRETAAKLQQTLHNFGVGVRVTNVSCGPSVTRYELTPDQGVKVSRIVNLSDDIKLNLAAADIRIEAPIPGKAAVGIEVPNKTNSPVPLRELLETKEFKEHPSSLAFAAGKDIAGKPVVADIARMPHLLIAGATGSGKSVCINTIIMSLLYKAKPEDVKLIMIDPKVVELSVYNGIPHLLIPVVTDPKKASGALNWAVAEMTGRYQKFAEYNVRDLKGYNKKVEAIKDIPDKDKPEKMPQIVIIVDELADLMMVAPGEVEDAICRLAQLARAAGIHLIIATQRPSVNVITGLIKANMPSRIAFSVSSGVDSRTIIDMVGAEKLLGKGDMLFYPQGYQKPARVQGAFVSDTEVSDVVEFLTSENGVSQGSADIESKITQAQSMGCGDSSGESEIDEYFEKAGRFIIEKDKASIGMLQRLLKIGFNRAARIMDQLADAGVVGPEEGTKPRKILMSMEEFEDYIDNYV